MKSVAERLTLVATGLRPVADHYRPEARRHQEMAIKCRQRAFPWHANSHIEIMMGETIDIPDAKALLCVEPHRRFIGLVVLVALRAGADQIRFESRPSEWCISAGRSDGSWEEMQPVSREAAVDCTLRFPHTRRAVRQGSGLTLGEKTWTGRV